MNRSATEGQRFQAGALLGLLGLRQAVTEHGLGLEGIYITRASELVRY